MNRSIIILLIVLHTCTKSFAQVSIIQMDSIVYGEFRGNKNNEFNQNCARICANYIKKNYSNCKLPLIYLNIKEEKGYSNDTIFLACDNFYGNILDSEFYDRKGKFYQSGISITLRLREKTTEILLKLLDYGINNYDLLEARKEEIQKMNWHDRYKSPIIPEKEILQIINQKCNRKIREFIATLK